MQSSAQALRLGLEQVRHMLPWDVGEHHVGLLANNARLSFQWFVDDMGALAIGVPFGFVTGLP